MTKTLVFKTYLSFVLFLIAACKPSAQPSEIQLIPKPVSLTRNEGFFELKNKATIAYTADSLKFACYWLKTQLQGPTGFEIMTLKGNTADLAFEILSPKNETLGGEGYTLLVEKEKVKISANTCKGVFWGIQTLLQLFPSEIELKNKTEKAWNIPCLSISDFPRFAWRGMMLDVSRHFFTKEEVKTYIQNLARYKINTFHWHLTDDQGWRIEIKSLPKLTSVGAWRVPRNGAFGRERKPPMPGEAATYGGFYTHDDIKEVVAFASRLGIQIIPEVDIPGHCMALLAAYPQLGCTKDSTIKVNPGSKFSDWYGNNTFKMNVENSLNPSDEKVYEAMDKIFTEVAQLFPANYIHIGGDECYQGYWKKDAGCKALMEKLKTRHTEDLQGYFMNRVKDIIKTKGKKVIGWDEVMEGGISNEAVIMFWRGWQAQELLPKAVKGGYKFIMSPTTTNYFDYYQGEKSIEPPVYAGLRLKDAYAFEPIPAGWKEDMVLGGQSNLWTENVQNIRHAEYMTFPRAWATAEVLWSPKGTNKQWEDFSARVEKHFERAKMANVKVSYAMYDPIIKYRKEKEKLYVELSSEANDVNIFYTLDDSMPDDQSKKYESPVWIPSDGAITMRIQAYRNGKPIGHLITLNSDFLKSKM